MTTLIGQKLGRYHIDEEIGRGGMARVYRATDSLLQRPVALKVLAPHLAVDPEFAHRFEREAVTAANLRHPNIVTIYDVGEHDGLRYIAMEYVRGRTLYAIIEDLGAIGLRYAVPITGAVAAALDYAHSHNAVHRDVKPQNIMIDMDGRVLLTDFGIAQAPSSGSDSGQRITKTGVFMGTPEYISPEQASANRVDGRSDLYSLGIATYEMITGAVPFSGTTLQLIIAHAQQPPPPPSEIDASLPPALDTAMMRILSKSPEDRFPTGMAFVDSLKNIVRHQGVILATNQQLSRLSRVSTSSAGQSTVRIGQEPVVHGSPAPSTPPPALSTPPPAPPAPPAPSYPATLPGNGHQGMPASAPPVSSAPQRRPRADVHTPPRPVSRPSTQSGSSGNGGSRISWAIAAPLLGGLFFVLLFVIFRDTGQTNPFTNTPVPVNTLFPTLVTNTPTSTPTATATATFTVEPTAEGTFTPIPSTTPVPIPTTTPRVDVFPFPTFTPTPLPPTEVPVEEPTVEPTVEVSPTVEVPTEEPTTEPGEELTPEPPPEEPGEPTVEAPTEAPGEPTVEPTVEAPTDEPTIEPGDEPTAEPPTEELGEPTEAPPVDDPPVDETPPATSSETSVPPSPLPPDEPPITMTPEPQIPVPEVTPTEGVDE
ncbi:MAG: protein kinase [Chloroflexota bacterium]